MSGGKGVLKYVPAIRIVARKFAASAFSGDGARLNGGRWNSPGTAMVYIAGSISLAILEWRVNLDQWPAPATTLIPLQIPEFLIWIPPRLPPGWQPMPAAAATASFGDAWIKSGRSAVMRVPSAVVPAEFNYLLNLAHPDFSKLIIGKPRLLKPDSRLGPIGTKP